MIQVGEHDIVAVRARQFMVEDDRAPFLRKGMLQAAARLSPAVGQGRHNVSACDGGVRPQLGLPRQRQGNLSHCLDVLRR